jgi:hypothetical protein
MIRFVRRPRVETHWRCLGGPALSLLADHDIALNRRLVVVHFVSDRRLHRDKSHSSGIRFVPVNLIRFRAEGLTLAK